MTHIQSNTFAEACYEMNSIEELKEALTRKPDTADMKQWNLTEDEYRENIELAIKALEEDAE